MTSKTTAGRSDGHFVANVGYPVYAVAFSDETQIIAAGGGGASRSGIKNTIALYHVDVENQKVNQIIDLQLSRSEDAPSTVAVHSERKEIFAGINSEAESVKQGKNENLRLYSYSDDGIKHIKSRNTLSSVDPEVYQKTTVLSKDGSKLAVGSSSSQLTVLSLPNLEPILPDLDFAKDELFDADFSEDGNLLLGAAAERICVWTLPTTPSTSSDPPEPLQVIERPVLKSSLRCTFRAARFGRGATASRLFTIVNAHPSSSSGGGRRRDQRNVERRAFISVWDAQSWAVITTRTVARKPVTSFDVSPDGTLLAVGGSDLSVSIFSADGIRPLLSVLAAHDFPSTTLRFSPSSQLLVSGSADNTLRVIRVDKALHPERYSTLKLVILALFVLLLAILIQQVGAQHITKASSVFRRHVHV